MATLSAPTIEELLVEVRDMLSQPSATNSTWSDESLANYLNEGVRRAFTEIIQTGEGQFTAAVSLNLVAGSETVALPTDCFKVKCLYRKVANGYEMLSYRNNLTEGYSTTGGESGPSYSPDYSFRGNSLFLRPVPNFNETAGLRLEYIQFPETMLSGGDSLTSQMSPIFRDLIIMYAVYKAKVKESLTNGTDTSTLARENLNDLFTSLREIIAHRSANPTAIIPFNPEE